MLLTDNLKTVASVTASAVKRRRLVLACSLTGIVPGSGMATEESMAAGPAGEQSQRKSKGGRAGFDTGQKLEAVKY